MLTLPPPVAGRIVFVDTEFTTLDREQREVWEIGMIIRDPGQPRIEVEWQLRPDLTHASGDSLRIGRYYERNRVRGHKVGTAAVIVGPGFEELTGDEEIDTSRTYWARLTTADEVAVQVARTLENAFLVGAIIGADELALDLFLRRHGQILPHHYRVRCIESMALGYLLGRNAERELDETNHVGGMIEVPPPPWDTKVLFRGCGVDPNPDRLAHRALVDARGVERVWDAMHGNVSRDN